MKHMMALMGALSEDGILHPPNQRRELARLLNELIERMRFVDDIILDDTEDFDDIVKGGKFRRELCCALEVVSDIYVLLNRPDREVA